MNAGAWRIITILAVAALALPSNAQRRTPAPQATKTFTAPNGAFQFSYPGDFHACSEGKIEPCIQSFIPVCEEDAFVCVVYPPKRFEGTNFGAASFQVREIHVEREAMTPDVCVTPYPQEGPGGGFSAWPEFMISAKRPGELIGGVLFVHGLGGDAATSHSKSVDLYRAFHSEKCFELSISETATSPEASDPPMKTLTSVQRKEMDDSMSEMLHSFRFLK
jgi:hypothetical protein